MGKPVIKDEPDIGLVLDRLDESMATAHRLTQEFIALIAGMVNRLEVELVAQRKAAADAIAQAKADRDALDAAKLKLDAMRIVLAEAAQHIAEFTTANDEEIQARIEANL